MKRFGAFAAVLMAALFLLSSCGGQVHAVLESELLAAGGRVQTGEFTCPAGDGDTLRVFYCNDTEHSCTVTLRKCGPEGTYTDTGGAAEVPPGGSDTFAYAGPGGETFAVALQSIDGGEVRGCLRIHQGDGI